MGGVISGPLIVGLASIGTAAGAAAGVAAIAGAAIVASGVGLTLSVVGAITKNKLLSQIGLGFSVAGALTGLGVAAGVFDPIGTQAITQESLGTGIVASTNPDYAAAVNTTGLSQEGIGQGIVAGTQMPASTSTVAVYPTPDLGAVANADIAPGTLAGQTGQAYNQPGTISTNPGASGLLSQAPPPTPVSAVAAPVTPSAQPGLLNGPSTFTGDVMNPLGQANVVDMAAMQQAVQQAAPAIESLKTASDLSTAWASLDPAMKATIAYGGGQAIAGGIGGIFTGMSTEKQLELQRLIDQENRQQFNQMFARATSSPGILQFGPPQPKVGA